MSQTIHPDGSPVRIEAVFWRHHRLCIQDGFDSIEEADSFLNSGADYGELSPVSTYVEGEPRTTGTESSIIIRSLDELRLLYVQACDENGRRPAPERRENTDVTPRGALGVGRPALAPGKPGDGP